MMGHNGKNVNPEPVLLVEPDPARRRRFAEALRKDGRMVVEAPGPNAALYSLMSEHATQPAMILLALETEEMSGQEFIDIVKSYYRLSRIPVVMFSAGRSPDREAETTATVVHLGDREEQRLCEVVRSVLEGPGEP